MKGKIICEVEKCLGCKNCQLSCALSHSGAKTLGEAISMDSLPHYRLKIETRDGASIPNICRHCEDAPCIASCKFEALFREGPNAPVLVKLDLCKGCKKCVKACPYGVLKMTGEGKERKVVKCDFCIERLKRNEEPACVIACPTQALKFIQEEGQSGKEGLCLVEFVAKGSEKTN